MICVFDREILYDRESPCSTNINDECTLEIYDTAKKYGKARKQALGFIFLVPKPSR